MLHVQDSFQSQIKSCIGSLSPNQWSLISALAFAIIGIISISCGMGKVAPPSGNLSLIALGSAFLTPVPILLIVFAKNHVAKKLPQANFEIIEFPPQVDFEIIEPPKVDFKTITPSNFDGIFYTLSPEESHIRDMGDVTIKKEFKSKTTLYQLQINNSGDVGNLFPVVFLVKGGRFYNLDDIGFDNFEQLLEHLLKNEKNLETLTALQFIGIRGIRISYIKQNCRS